MAQVTNGFVYHTKFDRYNLIPRRTYQLTGDNLLNLIKALGTAPELEDPAVRTCDYLEIVLVFFKCEFFAEIRRGSYDIL